MLGSTENLRHALSLMETALILIDEAEAAADVGAHLDLAIHRLRETLAAGGQATYPTTVRATNTAN